MPTPEPIYATLDELKQYPNYFRESAPLSTQERVSKTLKASEWFPMFRSSTADEWRERTPKMMRVEQSERWSSNSHSRREAIVKLIHDYGPSAFMGLEDSGIVALGCKGKISSHYIHPKPNLGQPISHSFDDAHFAEISAHPGNLWLRYGDRLFSFDPTDKVLLQFIANSILMRFKRPPAEEYALQIPPLPYEEDLLKGDYAI